MTKLIEEFPSFPLASLPTIPSTWEDTSWHNDQCPCFTTEKGLYVFIDFLNKEEREFPECDRFTVSNDKGEVIYNGNVWKEVLFHTN